MLSFKTAVCHTSFYNGRQFLLYNRKLKRKPGHLRSLWHLTSDNATKTRIMRIFKIEENVYVMLCIRVCVRTDSNDSPTVTVE